MTFSSRLKAASDALIAWSRRRNPPAVGLGAGRLIAHAVGPPPRPEYVYTYYASIGGKIVGGYEFGPCGTSSWGTKADVVTIQVVEEC